MSLHCIKFLFPLLKPSGDESTTNKEHENRAESLASEKEALTSDAFTRLSIHLSISSGYPPTEAISYLDQKSNDESAKIGVADHFGSQVNYDWMNESIVNLVVDMMMIATILGIGFLDHICITIRCRRLISWKQRY